MRNDFWVNEDECIKCYLCAETHPDSFLVDDAGSVIVIPPMCDSEKANICPVDAIIDYGKKLN